MVDEPPVPVYNVFVAAGCGIVALSWMSGTCLKELFADAFMAGTLTTGWSSIGG